MTEEEIKSYQEKVSKLNEEIEDNLKKIYSHANELQRLKNENDRKRDKIRRIENILGDLSHG